MDSSSPTTATNFFSVAGITPLNKLKPAARIHVIGVCGVAMAQMAIELSKRGFCVSGSDKEFFEPMASLLKGSAVKTINGYEENNISADLDLVLIGNAVSRQHPEVLAVQALGLPYTIFPALLRDLVISDRHSIVVSGTHGKTTTTALTVFALEQLRLQPSYFLGGAALDLRESLSVQPGQWSVVEGDEYDSAFFAKVPKFAFYAPNTWLITSLEYDHADIYPDLAAIEAVFNKQVKDATAPITIVCHADGGTLSRLSAQWRAHPNVRVLTYGAGISICDSELVELTVMGRHQRIVARIGKREIDFTIQIPGAHNALNAVGALTALEAAGVAVEDAALAMADFRGVRRRQEERLNRDGVIIIDDFAHHPTAVYETIKAIRAKYPDKTLWAVFEPRSNTSRRKVFQRGYVDAFCAADRVVLCNVTARSNDTSGDLIEVAQLAADINSATQKNIAVSLENAAKIADYIGNNAAAPAVILVMSNGSFDGLVERLIAIFS